MRGVLLEVRERRCVISRRWVYGLLRGDGGRRAARGGVVGLLRLRVGRKDAGGEATRDGGSVEGGAAVGGVVGCGRRGLVGIVGGGEERGAFGRGSGWSRSRALIVVTVGLRLLLVLAAGRSGADARRRDERHPHLTSRTGRTDRRVGVLPVLFFAEENAGDIVVSLLRHRGRERGSGRRGSERGERVRVRGGGGREDGHRFFAEDGGHVTEELGRTGR
jgi:hypothetical protein